MHTRLRSLVASAFARGHVERLRPRVQPSWPTQLLDAVDLAAFDLIADFAEPLPVAVIAELLGVPEADRHLLRPWSAGIVAMYEYGRTDGRRARAPSSRRRSSPTYMRDLADGTPRASRARTWSATWCAAEDDGRAADRATSWWPRRSCCSTPGTRRRSTRSATGSWRCCDASRPAGPAARRRVAWSSTRDRGDDPLRRAAAAVRADGEGGRRARRRRRCRPAAQVAALLGSANRDPAAFDRRRRASTSAAGPTRTSGSAPGCTTASVRRWPGWSCRSRCRRCCAAAPSLHLAGDPVRRPTFVLRGYSSVPVSAD